MKAGPSRPIDNWPCRAPAARGSELGPAASDAPRHDEIRAELGRIIASTAFRDSLRLTRFITFVVEATINGLGGRIKAYTVAVEALGRGSDFDPQSDPIVRVEACRLRHALARYYEGPGRHDALVIDLPRGAYVPSFRRRDGENRPPSAALNGHDSVAERNLVPDRPGEIGAHRRQLHQSLATFRGLMHRQRLQLADIAEAIASATQTLNHSRALLHSDVTTEPSSGEPSPVGNPSAAPKPIRELTSITRSCAVRVRGLRY